MSSPGLLADLLRFHIFPKLEYQVCKLAIRLVCKSWLAAAPAPSVFLGYNCGRNNGSLLPESFHRPRDFVLSSLTASDLDAVLRRGVLDPASPLISGRKLLFRHHPRTNLVDFCTRIRASTSLTAFAFEGHEELSNVQEISKLIVEAVKENSSIIELSLSNVYFPDPVPLISCISRARIRTLHFSNLVSIPGEQFLSVCDAISTSEVLTDLQMPTLWAFSDALISEVYSKLSKMRHLITLDLSSSRSSAGRECFTALADISNLSSLKLGSVLLDFQTLDSTLARCARLRSLTIGSCSGDSLALSSALVQITALETLSLGSLNSSTRFYEVLFTHPSLTALELRSVRKNEHESAQWSAGAVAALAANTALRTIRCSRHCQEEFLHHALAAAMACGLSQLQSISLGDLPPLFQSGLEEIAKAVQFPRRRLALSLLCAPHQIQPARGAFSRFWSNLGSAPGLKELRFPFFFSRSVFSTILKFIAQNTALRRMRIDVVGPQPLSASQVSELAIAVQENTYLEELQVGPVSLETKACESVATMLRVNSTLRSLALAGPQSSSSVLKIVSSLLFNQSLCVLVLPHINWTEAERHEWEFQSATLVAKQINFASHLPESD